MWRANHTLKVPESLDELRDLLANKTRFDLDAADAFVDRLGTTSGQDIHGAVRLVAGLVLTNESFGEFYERATDNFKMAATRLRSETATYNFSSGLAVVLPALGLPANQTLSVMQWMRNPYEALSSQPLNSSVVSIMVADAISGNETRIADLKDLLNFTIPVDGLGHLSRMSDIASCVYWNGTEWSGEGCQALSATDFEVTCGCTHLTDFAVILAAPQALSIISVPSPSVQPIYESLLPSRGPYLLISVPSATAEPSKSSLIIGLSVGGCLLVGAVIVITALNVKHKRAKEKIVAEPNERWAWSPTKDLEAQEPNSKPAVTKNVLSAITVRK
jgi:hypothetical protein